MSQVGDSGVFRLTAREQRFDYGAKVNLNARFLEFGGGTPGIGGGEGIRTPDPCDANAVLSR